MPVHCALLLHLQPASPLVRGGMYLKTGTFFQCTHLLKFQSFLLFSQLRFRRRVSKHTENKSNG
jgi:hypothetical protein